MQRQSSVEMFAFLSSSFNFLDFARVVKWQTRTFEGRMPKGMGVQVPPRAGRFAERPTRLRPGRATPWRALNVQHSTFN